MFTGKVRTRVCGLLVENQKILLLKHKGLGSSGFLWSPPGGGIEFDGSAEIDLVREFREETGLQIRVLDFLFVNEYRDSRVHAVELFFSVERTGGNLQLGTDPELEEQILTEAAFLGEQELKKIPTGNKHNIFSKTDSINDLFKLNGYYKFEQFFD